MTTDTEERGVATLTAGDTMRGLQTVRSVLAPDLSDDELKLFAMVATRSGLDPFAKQIYAIKRKGRVTFQTSIDGYRSIAARTGLYDGQDEAEYGPWIDKPYGHPEFATVRVHRKGVTHPIAATAYWDEYVADPGQSGMGDVMWKKMPRVMIAKVAEALALRKAFPYDPERREGIGADVYTADEMAQADRKAPGGETGRPQTPAAKVAQRRAAVEKPADPAAVDETIQATEIPGVKSNTHDPSDDVVDKLAGPPTDAPGAADELAAAWTSAPTEDVAAAPADAVEGDVREVTLDIVAKLQELAGASTLKGDATEPQRARLRELIPQLGGADAFRPVVLAAFGASPNGKATAGQAEAILSIADSFEDPAAFVAAWAASAAAVPA